jgi:hypothetical protein
VGGAAAGLTPHLLRALGFAATGTVAPGTVAPSSSTNPPYNAISTDLQAVSSR